MYLSININKNHTITKVRDDALLSFKTRLSVSLSLSLSFVSFTKYFYFYLYSYKLKSFRRRRNRSRRLYFHYFKLTCWFFPTEIYSIAFCITFFVQFRIHIIHTYVDVGIYNLPISLFTVSYSIATDKRKYHTIQYSL